MPSRKLEDLHPRLQAVYIAAVSLWDDIEVTPFLTCTSRSLDEQDELYALGRTKPGRIVTKAKAGQSAHNYLPSFAFDVAFKTGSNELRWDRKYFNRFAELVKQIDPEIVWGGNWRFTDLPHFQIRDWESLLV